MKQNVNQRFLATEKSSCRSEDLQGIWVDTQKRSSFPHLSIVMRSKKAVQKEKVELNIDF